METTEVQEEAKKGNPGSTLLVLLKVMKHFLDSFQNSINGPFGELRLLADFFSSETLEAQFENVAFVFISERPGHLFDCLGKPIRMRGSGVVGHNFPGRSGIFGTGCRLRLQFNISTGGREVVDFVSTFSQSDDHQKRP